MTRILYVEDNPASQLLVKRILQAEGFEVILADSGLAAIEVSNHTKPDLILMDINIGALDGYEVTTRLRTINGLQNTPIVAVTAATLDGDRERALVAGCDGYIAKPINVDTFPDQIRSYLVGMKEEISSIEEREVYLLEYNQRLVQRLEEKVRDLEKANAEMQRVEKMKSDFVMLAGHELRTPLTVVYGYLQILMSDDSIPGSIEAEGTPKLLLHRVFQAAERLSQVIQDILNVSLIDANRLELAHEPVFLNSTLQSVLHNLLSCGRRRAVDIELGPGIPRLPPIEGDPRRLHQAFWNVISNAVKFTPDGGSVIIDGETVNHTVHVWVKDTGIGIPTEDLQRIFERFYVLEDVAYHRSSKTAFKGGGLGLGLAVSEGIIKAHDGKIWAESGGSGEAARSGTTMHILLPVGEPFRFTDGNANDSP